ncbi:MAG: hypothetical protein AB1488_07485 [Nitrospirota bacterium]
MKRKVFYYEKRGRGKGTVPDLRTEQSGVVESGLSPKYKKVFYYIGLLLFLLMLSLIVLLITDTPSSLFNKAVSKWIEKQWGIKAEIMSVRPTCKPSLHMEDVTIKGTVPNLWHQNPPIPPLLKGGERGLESGLSPKYSIRLRKVDVYPVWFSLLSGRFTWRFTSTTQSNGSINGIVSESAILNWKDIAPSDIKIKAVPFRFLDGMRISGNASIKKLKGNNRGAVPKTLDISIFGLPTGNTSLRLNNTSVEGKVTVFIKMP